MSQVAARPDFILASASPRRKDLLAQMGIVPDAIIATDIDETPHPAELPRIYAQRIAEEKGCAAYAEHARALILTADTVVAVGRRILGKPENADEARAFLQLMSGRRHLVLGGITLTLPDGSQKSRVVTSSVQLKRLSDGEITRYIESSEWQGKAGAYGIQGLASIFIKSIQGSYTNIVGLSLYDLHQMLSGLGGPPPYAPLKSCDGHVL